MQEVYEFLKAAGYYFLATVEGDQPRVRPFGTYVLFEDKFYIQSSKVKPVSKQMEANPKVELCAFSDGDSFKGGEWVRISAETVRDDRIEAHEAILEAHPQLRDLGYSAGHENMNALYLKNATATFYSHAGVIKVVNF